MIGTLDETEFMVNPVKITKDTDSCTENEKCMTNLYNKDKGDFRIHSRSRTHYLHHLVFSVIHPDSVRNF